MNTKKKILFVSMLAFVMGIFLSQPLHAQQYFQYSQYMFNRLALNPAVAGTKDALVLTMQTRRQWGGIPGAPSNQLIQFHSPLKKRRIGLGIEAMSNSVGPKRDAGMAAYYSYKFPLFTGNLSMGIKYGIRNYSFNWDKVDMYNSGDVFQTANVSVYTTHQTAVGAYWYSTNSYVGFSAIQLIPFNITKTVAGQDVSETRLHYFATACRAFQLGSSVLFSPTMLVKMVGHAPVSTDFTLNFLLNERFWLGAGYRSAYGFNVVACYKAGRKFRIGYSYDMGSNKIGKVGGTTHELLLEFNFNIFNSKTVTPRYL